MNAARRTAGGKSARDTERRLFVLDTNVLMHDPTAIFRFQEHDVYLPMVVLEELDANKKGLSEASRNVRQVSRFLDDMMRDATKVRIASSRRSLASTCRLSLTLRAAKPAVSRPSTKRTCASASRTAARSSCFKMSPITICMGMWCLKSRASFTT